MAIAEAHLAARYNQPGHTTYGAVLGVERFGASAPGKKVLEEYGFTARNVAARAFALLSGAPAGG